jgi:outer membrane lipoprotein carrier protein
MHSRVICGLLVACWISPQAAGQVSRKAQVADAKRIVRAVEARYAATGTLQATFLERYSQGRNQIRVESGTVYFSRPGRMRWEYESPEEKLFLVDGTNVWFYVPADRTATRARLKESADWHTPLALLAGKTRRGALSRLCKRIELLSSSSEVRTLHCLPKSKKAPFKEVILEVDRTYRLGRVLIREPGGVETEFRFAGWRENVRLPEVMFHFQAPKGVAIVEQASIAGAIR